MKIYNKELPVYRNYKDRVFRMLFKDKKKLLELYNALNNTSYMDENDLVVNTLENAIFMKMKNDVSFVVDCDICLYEQQSTYCPNMPLRGFLYFADLYKKLIKDVDLSVSRQIKIPTPHYIVFYNGSERTEEEFVQKLSDAFEDGGEGCIQIVVRTININFGKNKKLLKRCKTLYDYAYFVAAVRRNLQNMAMQDAVENAIEECISKDILKDFLLEQKAEVVTMSIYEYNEEYVRKTLYEDGKEIGFDEGKAEGKAEMLVQSVEAAMRNFNIDLEAACEGLGTTVEAYQRAKRVIHG